MRINRIKLKNFIGIYKGLHKNEIEINFNKNSIGDEITSNRIVVLAGSNGSGKSTILSTLHPFAGTEDNRVKFIIDGEEGYKEIEFQNGEDIYLIKHYYKRLTRSYISKNGEELNENGNVRSFEEAVKRELGIDKDYFKIGRISSNVSGFVDLQSGERKNYINKFLPNIDEWLDLYKIVKDKHVTLKKDIKYVSDQLNRLDDPNSLDISIQSLDNKKNNVSSELLDYEKKLAVNLNLIKDLNKENCIENGNPYKEEYLNAKNELSKNSIKLDRYIEKYSTLKDYNLNKCNEKIKMDTTKLEVSKNNLEHLEGDQNKKRSEITTNKNNYNEKKIQLDKLTSNGSYDELNELYREEEKKLKEIKKKIDSNKQFKEVKISYKSLLSISSILNNTSKQLKQIKDLNIDVLEFISNANRKGTFDEENLQNALLEVKQSIKYSKSRLEKLNNFLSVAQNNLSLKNKLKLRPKNCREDMCPFIRDAIKFKNIEEEIASQEKQIRTYKENLEDSNDKLELYTSILNVYDKLSDLYNEFTDDVLDSIKSLKIYDYCESFEAFVSILENNKSFITDLFDVSDLRDYLELLEDYSISKNRLNSIKTNLDVMKTQLEFISQAEDDLNNLQSSIKDLNIELKEINSNIENENKLINKYSRQIEIIQDLINLITSNNNCEKLMNELHDKYYNIEESLSKIKEIEEENSLLNKNISIKQKEIEKIEKENQSLILKKNKFIEFTERKEKLESLFENIELVRNALNPIKGIPVYLTSNYLKETSRIVNELLDIAYDGKFRIKFELDDRNFFIQVLTGDSGFKNDIKEASQGEEALTTISLSLAMIEQSMSNEYNILQLDESDATLDTENRAKFIDIINNQIDRLDIEQVFVISHNNQFDAHPVDLILLKDHPLKDFLYNDDSESLEKSQQYLQGKNILFDFYK